VIVVDTSLFIEAERRRPQAEARVRELLSGDLGEVAVSAVTVLELTRSPRLGRAWREFYRDLFDTVQVLPVDRTAAELGAAIARDRQREGHVLPNADALIAGCAAAAGARVLVTADEDFAGIRAFEVELVRPS
jgi:predicted nucleic acid-binding protein